MTLEFDFKGANVIFGINRAGKCIYSTQKDFEAVKYIKKSEEQKVLPFGKN
ncbi:MULTISPECIES: hypothetical protein [unclassified Nostoc]|uniref:hypothetical protein n=1 Tax=unclassified Nostoc TaxID=2593658 RepID=UPI002619A166|nr:hypothetical protein [Nostoc sp. S13]MDF5738366.1 hypothetical protein [Nostoc sp. S13]